MLSIIEYEEQLPIKVQLLKIQEYPWHMHRDIQIIYILEGEIDLKLTYTSYSLKKNHIHFIHSDDVHGLTGIMEENLIIMLSINMDYFSKFFPNLDTQVFSTRINEDTASYIKQQMELKYYIFSIISLLIKKDIDYKDNICNLSKDLISTLYKDFRGFAINRTSKVFEPKLSHDLVQTDRISRVVSFVYENYKYKLSLAEIAENEHINKYYLSHLFQKFVCENFRDFLSMVRVEMSESMLLGTEKSISLIASQCGFSSAKYYIEHFNTWFGVHPTLYRDNYKKNTIDYKKSYFFIEELKSIATLVEDYLTHIAEFSAGFSTCLNTKISLDFSHSATIPFNGLNDFTFQINDPDLYDDAMIERNALSLSEHLKTQKISFKIAIHEPPEKKVHKSETDYASVYLDTFIQSGCIEILKKITGAPLDYSMEPIHFIDNEKNTTGLFTVNGLRKPLFYLLDFFSRLGSTFIQSGNGYIIIGNNNEFQFLLFNASYEKSINFELDLRNIEKNYKLTEERLLASSSCIDYWCQLNFNGTITPKDFAHIENMSMPRVSFEIIPKSALYLHSLTLDPHDIALIQIETTD